MEADSPELAFCEGLDSVYLEAAVRISKMNEPGIQGMKVCLLS